MAYEKLSVVYQYRDDPNCAESDEEPPSPDWHKDQSFLQKESQNKDNRDKKGLLSSNSQKDSYNKVDVNGSPEKPASDKDRLSPDEDKGKQDRRTVSERFKGAFSNASQNFGNWLLTSTRNSVPVDTFMCGGNAGLTSDNLERTLCPSQVSETRKY